MKFKANKEILLKEIAIAQEISNKNSFSILSNLYLNLIGNNLEIKATDGNIKFKTFIPVEGEENGEAKVFCDRFLMIIKNFPKSTILIEKIENEIILRDDENKMRYNLNSTASEDFPEFETMQNQNFFSLSQAEFIEMINQTQFSVSNDETRYFMNGVCLEKIENKLNMIATDGRRLSFISKTIENIPDFKQIIIPPKTLNIIKKICMGEGNIDLGINENTLFIKVNNSSFSSTLITSQFPNYKKVIPENQQFNLILKRTDLLDAVRRVDLLIEKNSKKVLLDINHNTILLKTDKTELGEAKESIDCTYEGEPIVIAFNSQFISDPLKVIESEFVEIQFTSANKAVTIQAVPQKEYFHIIMPMQTE